MQHRPVIKGAATAVVLVICTAVGVSGCGDDQNPWCAQLESVADLKGLASALSSGDSSSAAEEVDHFTEVARAAPSEIRKDMEAVADALSEVVAVATNGDKVDPDDLELRREAVNEQLGRVTTNISAVSTWAERECGIRLD